MNLLLRNNLFVAIHFHLGSPLVPIVILGPIIVFKTGNAISSAVVSSRYFFRCRSVLLQFKYLMDYGIIIRYEMNVSVDNSPEIPLSSEIGNRLDIILI